MLGPEESLHREGGALNIVKDGTPEEVQSAVCRSLRLSDARRALSPARSPRVPPKTMLGPEESLHRGGGAPNIVKDGTPQEALSPACRSLRPSNTRGGLLPLRSP